MSPNQKCVPLREKVTTMRGKSSCGITVEKPKEDKLEMERRGRKMREKRGRV